MMEPLLSPLSALKLMIGHYSPSGRPGVALQLGKADTVLEKELAGGSQHKFGVVDACLVAAMCHEAGSPHAAAFATAVAACSGGHFEPGPARDADPVCAQRTVGEAMRESAEAAEAALTALADGVVTRNEARNIRRQVAEAINALQRVQVAVDAMQASTARRPKAVRS